MKLIAGLILTAIGLFLTFSNSDWSNIDCIILYFVGFTINIIGGVLIGSGLADLTRKY